MKCIHCLSESKKNELDQLFVMKNILAPTRHLFSRSIIYTLGSKIHDEYRSYSLDNDVEEKVKTKAACLCAVYVHEARMKHAVL